MTELISKCKVVDMLTSLENEFQHFKPFEGFEHAMYRKLCEVEMEIGKTPGVTIPKWIPVSERLPKREEAVLCFIKNGEQDILQFDVFENLWVGRQWTYKRHAITHWMPLPEPPQEE